MNRRITIVVMMVAITLVVTFNYFLLSGDAILNVKQKYDGTTKKITMGWVGPLTGQVALLGKDSVKAVQLAVYEYNNGRATHEPEINLVIEDDRYDSSKSVTAFRKLVTIDKADIVLLSTYSAMFLVADEALEHNVIVVNPVDNDAKLAKLNENMFMIAKETEQLGAIIADDLLEQGNRKAFILYFAGDEFMPTLANVVKDDFEKGGGTVTMQRYTKSTSKFNSPIFTGRNYHSDAYVLLGYTEIGTAMKQVRDAGITAQFYTANSAMAKQSDGAIEGTRFTGFTNLDGNTNEANLFLDHYRARYDDYPVIPWTALQSYDATRITIDAIRKASNDDGEFVDNLRQHMLSTHEFRGTSGNITIKPDGTSSGIYWNLYTFEEHMPVRNDGEH